MNCECDASQHRSIVVRISCNVCVRQTWIFFYGKNCAAILDRNRSYFMVHTEYIVPACMWVCECLHESLRERDEEETLLLSSSVMVPCALCIRMRASHRERECVLCMFVSFQEQTSSRASWCIKIQFVFFPFPISCRFFAASLAYVPLNLLHMCALSLQNLI